MNKVTLKYELDLDFVLIAITSQLKDYRLCFTINKKLLVEFCRIEELQLIYGSPNKTSFFSRYFYLQEPSLVEFYLLSNKGNDGYLIPEMNTADYFLLIRNYIDKEELDELINDLNKIPEIVLAVEVEPKRLRSKENLIF